MPVIDLAFPIKGDLIPIDHGYGLFSALCRVVPSLHGDTKVGVHPIRGEFRKPGVLGLITASRLRLRLASDKREFPTNLRVWVVLDGNPELGQKIRAELANSAPVRYGLPFLGDNAFSLDRLEVRESPPAAHWYYKLSESKIINTSQTATRLTIWIDHQRMSRTQSALFAPLAEATTEIPSQAWTEILPPTVPPDSAGKGKTKAPRKPKGDACGSRARSLRFGSSRSTTLDIASGSSTSPR